MYPTICRIGPLSIYSYGAMLAAAFLAASWLAREKAKTAGMNPELIFNLSFTALIAGVIGSRLLYVVLRAGYYLENPWEIFQIWQGGLSWFGGLGLGVIAAVLYIRKNRLPVYATFDLLVPFLALGQSIGRIGCLLNGCCYGREAGWGLYFPVHSRILIPTQVFSSLALLFLFLILRALLERPHKDGQVLFTYLFLYSVGRFIIEFWRADNPIVAFGLTSFQLISIAVLFFSLWKLLHISRAHR
jgi:phosphatidylglycerol:prolipoprotein diacylglycerol transferase